MLKTACAAIALLAFANPALAAGCASPGDASALKTAVMQQELMVAALQCHEADAYNRFVMTYRGELQSSDAALKAFFVRRGGEHGEAGYDTFKTKAANLSALEQARAWRRLLRRCPCPVRGGAEQSGQPDELCRCPLHRHRQYLRRIPPRATGLAKGREDGARCSRRQDGHGGRRCPSRRVESAACRHNLRHPIA